MRSSVTLKFMSRLSASQITPKDLTIIIPKDLGPVWINMLRRLDLPTGRGDDRHALLWFQLFVLFGDPLGFVGSDHLDRQA
jgi:hypothetical protein